VVALLHLLAQEAVSALLHLLAQEAVSFGSGW